MPEADSAKVCARFTKILTLMRKKDPKNATLKLLDDKYTEAVETSTQIVYDKMKPFIVQNRDIIKSGKIDDIIETVKINLVKKENQELIKEAKITPDDLFSKILDIIKIYTETEQKTILGMISEWVDLFV